MIHYASAAVEALMNTTAVEPARVPVYTGWGPGTYALYAILLLISPLVIALFKYLPTMRSLKDQSDDTLRKDLLARINEVEDQLTEARKSFDRAIAEERASCDRRLDAYQRKMDAITRKFFQFQLSLVQYLPSSAAPIAQKSADHILEIIEQPIESFMEAPSA